MKKEKEMRSFIYSPTCCTEDNSQAESAPSAQGESLMTFRVAPAALSYSQRSLAAEDV